MKKLWEYRMRCIIKGSFLVLSGVVALGLGMGGAYAASGNSGESQKVQLNDREFQSADQNKDGRLSLEEFDDYTIAIFSAMDKNHNKILDQSEQAGGSSTELRALDINADEKITFQEFMRASNKNFMAADKDKDKKLSLQELNAF
jgi:hypothetical protein